MRWTRGERVRRHLPGARSARQRLHSVYVLCYMVLILCTRSESPNPSLSLSLNVPFSGSELPELALERPVRVVGPVVQNPVRVKVDRKEPDDMPARVPHRVLLLAL